MNSRRKLFIVDVFIFLVFVLFVPAVQAQFDTATVLGLVRDQSGAVVPGVAVSLINLETGITVKAVTDEQGNYQFVNARIGMYRVRAEMAGFAVALAEPFTATVNARQRVDLMLTPGQVTETVVVTAAAALVEADSSDRGQVISGMQIQALPLNGRNYADLALLTPGVRSGLSVTGGTRDASFNVHGQRVTGNNFLLDGIDNNAYGTSNQGFSSQVVQVSPDALAEFKIQTNNYSAEFGRAAGAVINASVRSGTNEFHGSLWEYHRNTVLNAVGFFKPVRNEKPSLIRNQFGFTFGGPIRRDRSFVFLDYEGFRQISRSLRFATLPTSDQRRGILGVPVRHPLTGQLFADGVIPESQITPFARQVLNSLPAPQHPGLANNFENSPRVRAFNDKFDVKVDHHFIEKLTSFVRISQRKANDFEPPVVPLPIGSQESNGHVRTLNQQLAGGATFVPTARLLLEYRLAISRTLAGKTPAGTGGPGMLEMYGIPGLPTDPKLNGGLNSQNISGFTALGRQSTNPQFQNPFVVNNRVNLSRVAGSHSLKMGYEFQAIKTEVDDLFGKYGLDSYSGQFSRPSTAPANTALYNLADFMFGARSQYILQRPFYANLRQRMHFAYLQNDIKLTPRLTLNLGVRYEYATPQYERDNLLANYDPERRALVYAKNGSISDRALVDPDRNNFAPRFGLAWSATRRTAIRLGYGISYAHFNRVGPRNLLALSGAHTVQVRISQLPTQPLCTANSDPLTCFRPTTMGYQADLVTPEKFDTRAASVNFLPRDTRTGYLQSWHLTVQHQISRDWLVDLGYVGNLGVKMGIITDINQARPNGPAENTSLQDRRPLRDFSRIQMFFPGGVSTYHGLQAKLEKRFSGGFLALNSFTWSKAIDNGPPRLEDAGGDGYIMNLACLRCNKGLSGFDQRINNTSSFVWEVPFGNGRRFGNNLPAALNAPLGGWRLTGTNSMRTGQPMNLYFTPAAAFQVTEDVGVNRANVIGDPYIPSAQRAYNNYLNPQTVLVPTDRSQPFGNVGRNTVRSYAFYQFDLGMHKEFALPYRETRVEIRAEFFNVLNKTNFLPAESNRSATTFGISNGTFPARQVQLALRVQF